MITRRTFIAGSTAAAGLVVGSTGARAAGVPRAQDSAPTRPLTNLAHLQWLLDSVPLQASSTHTTYEIAARPTALAPWTYADAQSHRRLANASAAAPSTRPPGTGPKGPTTRTTSPGPPWSSSVTRCPPEASSSRDHAAELLRTLTFLQDATGPYAGNVVLWMQADGTLNPSAEPRELPDPSDSDESYWLARTVWALGEGYAAFAAVDPRFAGFLHGTGSSWPSTRSSGRHWGATARGWWRTTSGYPGG